MRPKLLFIPLDYNKTPRPHEDFLTALAKHFDVEYFSHQNTYDYDFVFMQSGAVLNDVISFIKRGQNCKVIQWTGDARDTTMENVTQYKGTVDLTLLAVGIGQKEIYERELGSRVDYMQQGVFNKFFIEPLQLDGGAITFIGNRYNQFEGAIERNELCAALSNEFNEFEVIGNGFNELGYNNIRSVPYDESAVIYNDSFISISHACFNDIEGYYSNRTLDIMAAGGCCLMRYVPNAEKLFEDGKDLLFYNTNEECIDLIKFLKNKPEVRNEIAKHGKETAMKQHSFAARAKQLYNYTQTL